jgi:hypothetical protein
MKILNFLIMPQAQNQNEMVSKRVKEKFTKKTRQDLT